MESEKDYFMNVSIVSGKDEYDIPDCTWNINTLLYNQYKVKGFFFYPNDSDKNWKAFLNDHTEFFNHKNNLIKCTDKTIFKLVDVKHLESISNFDDFIKKQELYHLYPSLIVAEVINYSDTNNKKSIIYARRVVLKQRIIDPFVNGLIF